MRTTLSILAVVLVAQLALAGALYFRSSDSAAAMQGPLFTFDTEAVDAIRITDTKGDTIRIERTDSGWQLPAAEGFPASQAKVDRLLSNAHAFSGRLPVARSKASWKRFSVAPEKYERRIEFIVDGETRATLYVGDSAGAGQVYVRGKGDTMLYEVDFALHYAATDVEDWLDQSVAAVSPAKVRKIVLPEFTLKRAAKESGWKLIRGGSKPETWAKDEEVDQLLSRLAKPDFEGVAKAEAPEGEPAFVYTLVTKEGEKIRYAFYGVDQQDAQPRFYREGQPWAYQVSDDWVAKLKELKAKRFVAEKPDKKKDTGDNDAKNESADGARSTDSSKSEPASQTPKGDGDDGGSKSSHADAKKKSAAPEKQSAGETDSSASG